MKDEAYTLLIIPRRKAPVKRVSASSRLVGILVVGTLIAFVTFSGFTLDYILIQRDRAEVLSLRALTEAQEARIAALNEKMGRYERAMADLQDFDAKIRTLAREMNQKTRIALAAPARPSSPLGVGGSIPEKEAGHSRIDRLNRSMDRMIEEAALQERSFRGLLDFFRKQKSILACVPSLWPVRGWVSSEFGARTSPFSGCREFHRGMDIATEPGREIIAPADGIVVLAGREPNMGQVVSIHHSRGISTFYAHLLRSVVRKGQVLRRGDVIGFVGSSGRSTGPHLHYTVLLNGVPVNPRNYLN